MSRYTPPMVSTKETVSDAGSTVALSVMEDTISGSANSHTVVSAAQHRSKTTVFLYLEKYGRNRLSRVEVFMAFPPYYIILPIVPHFFRK